ncbi:rhamnan synthesis F family protein [Acidisoma sp. S159]|uniref:rhamnan synthesis F family protein n=1 Tax=Acidisoma sp. S159 TaxID=1747225 RepID=UPI00131E5EF4|nr:rhamnan synthesis F family protein [Acidisoma sp. S159]
MAISEAKLPDRVLSKPAAHTTVAVCIHAFYLDVLQEMLPYLHYILVPFDLFVTCLEERRTEVASILEKAGVHAEILSVENIGMDVLPFVQVVKEYNLHRYGAILKLHTKNNFTQHSRTQTQMFLKLLLGSAELVEDILVAFATHRHLLMVGPHDLYRSAHYMAYNNRAMITDICKALKKPSDPINWGFFAGTMFWIRGSSLTSLARSHKALIAVTQKQASGKEVTGRDGSIAHALERLWGALSSSKVREIGLTYRCNAELTKFSLRIEADSILLEEPIRRLGASDVFDRWSRAREDVEALKRVSEFDTSYYCSKTDECQRYGIDPHLHFVLYGDVFSIDPSPTFSTSYYQLRRPDVYRKGVNTLAHFSTFGRREGYTGSPTFEDWFEVARSHRLIDEQWYLEEHGSVGVSGLSLIDHYRHLGRHLGVATSVNFDPALIPVLKGEEVEADPLATFLKTHYLEEAKAYNELTRVLQNNDYAVVPELIESIFDRFGVSMAPLSALGLCYVRSGNWTQAKVILERYWEALRAKTLSTRHRRSVLPSSKIGNEVFEDVSSSKDDTQAEVSVCVYTALYGDIDILPPIISVSKYCRFVCFTDSPGDVEGWEYRIAEPGLGDTNLNAKLYKVLSDDFLEQFDYSLFIDANTLLMGRLDELIEKYLIGNEFVMFRHPERSDVYTEAVAIVESERHSPAKLLSQLHTYSDAGLPNDAGLIEASFIWRASGKSHISKLMKEWWDHILHYSKRDQLSLGFLMWKNEARPKTIPNDVGNPRENKYFMKLPHAKLPHAVLANNVTRRVTSWARHADVWFLYGSKFVSAGSSVLRGSQLSEILRSAIPDPRGVFYTSFDSISDKIVILTKGYLAQVGVEGVARLKERGNMILADFVDARPNDDMMPYIDVLIASSLRAFVDYRRRYPEVRSHHVTHHVDFRIVPGPVPTNFCTGYFGELVNTVSTEQIKELVDFVLVDTSTSQSSWLGRLKDYSFHYAVRRERGIDHFKPFLKGFVAAHCGVNVMIQANAGDARFYLGEDYPYLLPAGAGPSEIVEALRRAKESIHSAEWRAGLNVMNEVRERSSREYVARELTQLLRTL